MAAVGQFLLSGRQSVSAGGNRSSGGPREPTVCASRRGLCRDRGRGTKSNERDGALQNGTRSAGPFSRLAVNRPPGVSFPVEPETALRILPVVENGSEALKAFLATFGGFVVALGMFVGGLALSAVVLTAEPARQTGPSNGIADVWTARPEVVDVEAQDFERVAAVAPSGEQGISATQAAGPDTEVDRDARSVDDVTTASVQLAEETPGEIEPASQLSDAHLAWCSSRYRSYRASDNSYRPYNGGRRACLSPFYEEIASAEPSASPDELDGYEDASPASLLQYAADETGSSIDVAPDHVSYCFGRYRSYRPADNTYQPYGGGPRRECR